ncbi:MAG: hypothetical protein ACLQVN_09665 [Bryobacteraceae bacterium]
MEAILLSRDGERMRAAVEGSSDAVEFVQRGSVWISDDCEPVRIEFAWQKKTRQELIDEADCVCSRALAARLIHNLLNDGPGDQSAPSAASPVVTDLATLGDKAALA